MAIDSDLDAVGAAIVLMAERVWEAVGEDRSDVAALNVVVAEPGQSIDAVRLPLGLSHSAAVRLIDRLEAAGTVERRPGRHGRAVALHPTSKGRRLAAQTLARRRSALARIINAIPETDRHAVVDALVRVAAVLTPDRAAADAACRLCDQRACLARGCPLLPPADDEPPYTQAS